MNYPRLLVALIAGLAATPSLAQKFPVVASEEASGSVRRLLSDIRWQTNLTEARSQARREGKLVFLVHMKGKIDGLT